MNTQLITTEYGMNQQLLSLNQGNATMVPLARYAVLVCATSVLSSSSTYGSTLHMFTNSNIIVQNIEDRLGVDMGVRTDAELRESLKENGAGPLYRLLKMAYGKKRKTTR